MGPVRYRRVGDVTIALCPHAGDERGEACSRCPLSRGKTICIPTSNPLLYAAMAGDSGSGSSGEQGHGNMRELALLGAGIIILLLIVSVLGRWLGRGRRARSRELFV